jgi:hypothetical protein
MILFSFNFIYILKGMSRSRPILKHEKSLTYQGDLLRASQICLVLDSSISDTLKRIKTGIYQKKTI